MAASDESDIIRVLEGLVAIDPSPATIQNAVERTRSVLKNNAAAQPPVPFRDEGQRRNSLVRPVAVLVAVATLLMGLAVWLGVGHTGNRAFAQVQTAMDEVATVAMTCEFEAVDGRKQGDQRFMIYDRNRIRIEFIDGDSISSIWIQDLRRNAVLMLQPAIKRWSLREQAADNRDNDGFTRVRQYRQGNVKQLPDRDVGGKRMLCFEVQQTREYREDWTIFADPESKLPQRIESVVKDLQGKILIRYVCKDFRFDRLDESLFSLDPPEGYEHLRVPLPPKQVPERVNP